MRLHDSERASLLASRGITRLGRSLALPESREAIWVTRNLNAITKGS